LCPDVGTEKLRLLGAGKWLGWVYNLYAC